MGSLRTLFAISVVFAHCWPTQAILVGGRNAVQLFYIISGFLISFVLVESRSYKTTRAFYLNRYLRLYPIYITVAVLTLLAMVVTHKSEWFDVYRAVPASADVLLAVSNLFMVGQDWVMFSGISHHSLVFVTDFGASDVPLFQGLLVPQAWTLGLELSFYLIAPFVLTRRYLIFGLLAASLLLRCYLLASGLGFKDPWTYRFFPAEIALFLLGALAHQLLYPFYERWFANGLGAASRVATGFMIVIALTYAYVPVNDAAKTIALLSVFLLLVPFTFVFQDESRIDGWIGNLSYPIYIGHVLVLEVVSFLSKRVEALKAPLLFSAATVVLTLIFAMILNRCVAAPFESIRRRVRSRSAVTVGG